MRLTPEQKAKKKLKKLKLEARRMWILHDAPPEPEKVTKQEFELFKKIAENRSIEWHVLAKHIWREWERGINPLWMKLMTFKRWEEGYKFIPLSMLTHWNFDHTIPKSRGKDYKLAPENIEIVSVAWHFYKTNWQVLKVDYPN